MLLELTGIEKTFAARRGGASVKALRGVDLAVDRGDMIAILVGRGKIHAFAYHRLSGQADEGKLSAGREGRRSGIGRPAGADSQSNLRLCHAAFRAG